METPLEWEEKVRVKDPLAIRRGGKPVLIIDGGFGTHIEGLGVNIQVNLWSAACLLENQSAIRQTHLDFFEAGADVVITASYQAYIEGFLELGVSEQEALDAIKKSVILAKEVAPLGTIVAGSAGTYGASLHNGAEYTGDFPGMDETKLVEWHRPRLKALFEAGCDVFACETIPCLVEARAFRRLADEFRHPAWLTFSCKSDTQVCSGELFADCVDAIKDSNYVLGAGVNCTDPKYVERLVQIGRAVLPPSKHLVVYPNCGEVYDGNKHEWVAGTKTTDQDFVDMAQKWIELGADCVGGCCRTTPTTIAALCKGLQKNS